VRFSPLRRRGAAQQIAESIRDAVLKGELKPGEQLPSERDLAAKLEVNRSTVREALHRLEALGLVAMRHGGATRVLDVLGSVGMHFLPHLLAPGGEADMKLLRDLLELRAVLLGWTAQRSAESGTPQQIAALEAAVVELESAAGSKLRQEKDFVFFEQLVKMTDNKVLDLIMNIVRQVYAQNLPLFIALYDADTFDTTNHRDAVEAIKAQDPQWAGACMRAYGLAALGALDEDGSQEDVPHGQ